MYIRLHESARYSSQNLMKVENFLGRLSKNNQILWKSFHWEPNCPMRKGGKKDRHDAANSRL